MGGNKALILERNLMKTEREGVFRDDFLDRLDRRDQPPTSQADTAGPWRVEAVGGDDGERRWACFALGDDEPEAVFCRRELALLAAAALPVSGAEGRLRLEESERRPYDVRELVGPVGTVSWWRDDLIRAMNHLAALVARPGELAYLLEAAGRDTLDRAGKILEERVRGADDG